MCGLAGLMMRGATPPDSRLLDAFEAAHAYRGPDGTGRHSAGRCASTHTRLAISDLTTGDQPLHDDAGRALVANGEIYNFVELREELGETRFKTKSDCEPPLLLIGEHG